MVAAPPVNSGAQNAGATGDFGPLFVGEEHVIEVRDDPIGVEDHSRLLAPQPVELRVGGHVSLDGRDLLHSLLYHMLCGDTAGGSLLPAFFPDCEGATWRIPSSEVFAGRL